MEISVKQRVPQTLFTTRNKELYFTNTAGENKRMKSMIVVPGLRRCYFHRALLAPPIKLFRKLKKAKQKTQFIFGVLDPIWNIYDRLLHRHK